MNRADLTRGVLLYEQLAEAAKAKAARYREVLTADARGELEQQGMAPSWKLPLVGQVVRPVSEQAIVVTNLAALTAWVAARYPDQIEHVEQIRPAYAAVLTKRLEADGAIVFDPQTGEVVPGVEVRAGGQPKALTIRPTPQAKALARQHADGLLERFAADLTADGA